MNEEQAVETGIDLEAHDKRELFIWKPIHERFFERELLLVKSVQSALSDMKRPPERLQSQYNYQPFIT